jgi:predicted ATPase
MLARSHYKCGNQVLALEHCEAGMHLAEGSGRAPATILGYSTAQLCLAWVLWLRGRVDRALVLARELIREGNKLKQPVYQCIRLMHCTPIIAWHGERAEAQDLVGQLVELSERHALPSYRSGAELLQGKMLVESGRPEEGCKVLAAAMAALAVVQVRAQDTTYACSLAEGLAATGATDEALSAVNEGIELCQQRGGTWDLPELLRVKALVLAARTPARAQEVDKVLYDAIELAQRQGALVWELRAATTLARERLRRGRPGKVLNHLGAVYARFTEGLQAPDLQAARVLLEGARAPQARAQT